MIDNFYVRFSEFTSSLNYKYIGCNRLEVFRKIYREIRNVYPECQVYQNNVSDILCDDMNIYRWRIKFDNNNNIVNITNG